MPMMAIQAMEIPGLNGMMEHDGNMKIRNIDNIPVSVQISLLAPFTRSKSMSLFW